MRNAALLHLAACTLQAQNTTRPGRFHVEHPTLLNLGFEWAIDGDANRNATVEVRFRKAGTVAWREALPLLRIGGEHVHRDRELMTYTVPHGFAGSILNLEPATSYECEFTMRDADGVTGQAQQRVPSLRAPNRSPSPEGVSSTSILPTMLARAWSRTSLG